jgi:hypothetical protein
MAAYSFQERFIPFLLDGSKDHTVRKERAGRSRHARPGETIQLYYGMRTKWCRKIGEATCSAVFAIRITENRISFPLVTEDEDEVEIVPNNRDSFAWRDGFRPEGSTADNPAGAFDLMLRFWKQTHELPFQGVVIYWKDFKAAK